MADTLELELEPDWGRIDTSSSETARFLTERGVCMDSVHALTMVATELLENANKYGSFRDPNARIRYRVTMRGSSITVEVEHPVNEHRADDLGKLDQMIQWIRSFQDPFQAYLERVKEVSAQSLATTDSGMGLVRIAYEGRSILDFFVDRQNHINVSAVHLL
ncbi:MAG: ATP-binding protein [Myxococcota bacterium]